MCRRREQSTQTTGNVENKKVTVTHPFLPNYKKEYTVKSRIKTFAGLCFVCLDENENEVYLPVDYTSLGKKRLSDNEQHGDVPCFNYKDLIELRKIINSIRM